MSAGEIRFSKEAKDTLAKVITSGVAVVGLVVAVFSFGLFRPELASYGDSAYQAGQIQVVIEKLAQLQVEQDEIRKTLNRPPASLEAAVLAQRLEALERRQRRIELVIMNSPEKAIEVPMLRNDLNNLKEANAQSHAAMKSSVDQIYDLNKWLLGAMALAIVGLAVTRLLTTKER